MARPRLGRVLGGRRIGIDANEYTRRRERLGELLARRGLDALFVPPGSDLEYLTGIERDLPTFGNISYAHGWVTGAFLAPGREPVYVLPRMFVRFHLEGGRRRADRRRGRRRRPRSAALGEQAAAADRDRQQLAQARTAVELLAVVPGAELSEGSSLVNELRRVKSEAELELMAQACRIARETMDAVAPQSCPGLDGRPRRGGRARAARPRLARPSFPTHIFTWGERRLDSDGSGAREGLREGEVVLFDFGAVWHGYCSDFGRTVACGEPPDGLRGGSASCSRRRRPDGGAARARSREVNAACRSPIEAAGLGDGFRHRMGTGSASTCTSARSCRSRTRRRSRPG